MEPFAHLGEPIHTPLVDTAPAADRNAVRRAIERLEEVEHVAFTSRKAVDHFLRELRAAGRDARALAGRTIAAVGEATAAALSRRGLAADLTGAGHGAEGLLDAYAGAGVSGARILLPVSDLARDTLADGLRAAGNRVEVVTVYRTVARADPVREELAGISLVAFSSPSGVAAFRELYGERLPAHLEIVALGELTARAARDAYPHHVVRALSG